MKVYFVRHGEGLDDLYNEYGSWSDRELSPHGVQTAFRIADKLRKLDVKFDVILTSPLKRAAQTAEVLGSELGLRIVENPYLKERNTYGLLSGVNKDLAIEEYPEMNAAFLEGAYILGSERYSDFILRIDEFLKNIKEMNYENIICSTHGHVITGIIEESFDLTRNSVGNGCILGVKIENGKMEIIHADGVSFTKDESIAKGVARRKFKTE